MTCYDYFCPICSPTFIKGSMHGKKNSTLLFHGLSLIKPLLNWETRSEEPYHTRSLKALGDVSLTHCCSKMDR